MLLRCALHTKLNTFQRTKKTLTFTQRWFDANTYKTRRKKKKVLTKSGKTVEESLNNILYSIPTHVEEDNKHTLVVLLRNEPGSLARVTTLLAGTGFNIEGLVAGETDVPHITRLTIVVTGKASSFEIAKRTIAGITEVWAILDLPKNIDIIEREMLLMKLSVKPSGGEDGFSKIEKIQSLCQIFGAKMVDVTPTVVTVEMMAKSSRIDALINLANQFNILEYCRSGTMVMPRHQEVVEIDTEESAQERVDDSKLPPS